MPTSKNLARLVPESPVRVHSPALGVISIDFGRVAFGNLRLFLPAGLGALEVCLGEMMTAGRIESHPPGCVRYAHVEVPAMESDGWRIVEPMADAYNTGAHDHPGKRAVLLPPEWGVVLPFRWVEIEGWPDGVPFDASLIERRSAYAATWDDNAAAFASSDDVLNRVWELCRYSIKATTFASIYVDGDRERIAYEGDAYINQLSHYACDPDYRMARETFDHLMEMPTWPTEWASHMVYIAHADWMHTGDAGWLGARFERLKTKLHQGRERADRLLTSDMSVHELDLIDWPPPERDGYEMNALNTVINACHYHAVALMGRMALALGKEDDAARYQEQAATTHMAFQRAFFDPASGLYRDGEAAAHVSLHANLFALAFGLVPEERCRAVIDFIKSRGMACSVYPAQYLLEVLFEAGEDAYALGLMMAPGDRSWRHMLDSGTTITWEAWDQRYKPNQDWNHAWGAAPANLLPRFVLGVQVSRPGWAEVRIRPHPGALTSCAGKVPTPRGPVTAAWKMGRGFELDFSLPAGMEATLELPGVEDAEVRIDGRKTDAGWRDGRLHVAGRWSGQHRVEVTF